MTRKQDTGKSNRHVRGHAFYALAALAVPLLFRTGAEAAVSVPQAGPAAQQGTVPGMANTAIAAVWTRTDGPVAAGQVKRTWFWGPQPNSGGLLEDYKEGAGGKRLVQYFDKSRMEINDPSADPATAFYVTNGLLTVELITGKMQTGKATFVQRQPSTTNVTGDAGDRLAPTYADFGAVSSAGGEHRDVDRTGAPTTATLSRGGAVGDDPAKKAVAGAANAHFEPVTGHNIPDAMWGFLNSSGPVNSGGRVQQQRLIEPWFYASGYPISEAYWTRATVAGKPGDVLVQAYERRVLTYVPGNPQGFQVEMGNIGQHYYAWRYGSTPPTPAPTQQPPAGIQSVMPRYAVDLVSDSTSTTLDLLKKAGAGGVRVYTTWAAIEPQNGTPDTYNWAEYDARFKQISDAGLSTVALITGCPAWACPADDHGPIPAERVGDFAAFMRAMAAHYGKAPYNVHIWEMFNEPDNSTGPGKQFDWGLHGAEYAAMLKAVQPAVKAADPSGQVVLGGVAYDNFTETNGPFQRRFVDDVLNADGGKYVDAFNFHYYVQNIHWCSMVGKLAELRAKLAAHGLGSLPVISTESGMTADEAFNSSQEIESMYAAQLYAQAVGEGMLSQTWFLARDFTTDVKGFKLFQKSGLLDLSGAQKPAYTAYSTATGNLGSRKAVRALQAGVDIPAGYYGYEFGPDAAHKGMLWVVWAWNVVPPNLCSAKPQPKPYQLPARVAAGFKAVSDMYGRPAATRASSGSVTFDVGAAPVYIDFK